MSPSPVATSQKIVDLRDLLAQRFAQLPPQKGERLVTGVASLDEATGGGLGEGQITEIISRQPSAGSALLIHSLLQRARRDHFFIALVDGRDSFDVQTAGGSALAHLLWARCQSASEAVKATDFLLRDGNFPLVILDLILNPPEELRRIPGSNWYRLQRLIEPVSTALVVMSRHNLVPSAQRKIVLDNQWTLSDLAQEQPLPQVHLQLRRSHRDLSALG